MDRLKRSHKPIFWALFGAGGTLAALTGPALVYLTGIAGPLGVVDMSFARVSELLQHAPGKAAIFLVISLFLFHGCHRMYHCLHDFGLHVGPGLKALFHGFALFGTLAAAILLGSVAPALP
jgi:fumarate reductase subunit D